MVIESEQSKSVSNDKLLQDIENTKREKDAYYNLWNGFLTLSRLPENQDNGERQNAYFQYEKYLRLEKECSDFLEKILALKVERGLKECSDFLEKILALKVERGL